MSSYAKLIIDGQEADAFSIIDIPLNLKNRISNLNGDVAGSFTRSTLSIPATKKNIALLDGKLDYLPFRIDINGATRISGLLQVKGGDIKTDCYNCVIETYDVNLYGGNSDWLNGLKDCTLNELTEETIVFDRATIQNGFNANPDTEESGFIFIKWHEWENSRLVTEAPPLSPVVNRQLESPGYFEATPFLFIRPLVIEMFRKQGYSIISNFIDSDFFKRLIMPVPLPDKLPQEYSEQFLNFRASLPLWSIITPGFAFSPVPYSVVDQLPPQNPGAWNGVTFQYTALEAGFYEVEFGFTFGPEVGFFNFVMLQHTTINGVLIPAAAGGASIGAGALFGPSTFPTGETRQASTVFKLDAGDTIEIQTVINTAANFSLINNFLRISGEATRTPGLTIDFKTLLNGLDALLLLKDIQKLFKLSFDTDAESKTIIIEPSDLYKYTQQTPTPVSETREGYYLTEDFKDYSKSINYKNKVKKIVPSLEGFINYRYLSDDEETINFVEEGQDLKIYEAEFSSPAGSDKGKTKRIETEFFAKTIHIRDNLTRYPDTEINPQFPIIYDDNYILNPILKTNEANYDVSPRILYFGGQRGGIDGYIEIYENPGVAEEVPAAFMVNYNDVSGLDPCLSWDSQQIGNLIVPGLVERFYLQCLARLLLREQKKAAICTNSIERDNFTFRQKALINGKKYIIQETESINPLQGLPDMFLFIFDGYASAELKEDIQNSLLSGVVSLFVK